MTSVSEFFKRKMDSARKIHSMMSYIIPASSRLGLTKEMYIVRKS